MLNKLKIMKKLITLVLGIAFAYSCSTSTDGNGNTTAAPVPPSNLTGSVVSTTQINLTWTDNSTNETGFKIERKTGTGTYAIVGTTATDITTFNDTGLTPSTTYTYRVYSYNAGGNSPTYSNELTLLTSSIPVTDIDGNTYLVVTICEQTWTKTNLNVSKYRNGDVIPQVTDLTQWAALTTGAWCYYANTSSNGTTYGKLYNWYAVNDSRGLAPIGYHIPSSAEWTTLVNCLGGTSVAGGKMKEIGTSHWNSPNTGATNISGFTGLPGGSRYSVYTAGTGYEFIGYEGDLWSASESSSTEAWVCNLRYSNSISGTGSGIGPGGRTKKAGFSVRCIKD